MFYITEKLDPTSGTFAFNPLQVASSFEEGIELIAGVARTDPVNIQLGVANIDAAGNVFRFVSVATPTGFDEYRITQLRRS